MQTSRGELVRSTKPGVSLFAMAAGVLLVSACGSGDDSAPLEDDFAENAALLAEGEGVEDESSCLDGIDDFGARGPFRYSSRRIGRINMLIPDVPDGCKVPVAHLANGTGASCGIYQSILNSLASHGFLTTCYESTNTGAGTQGLEAFQTALEEYPELASRKFASLGHSQGGQAAFTVLALAEQEFGTNAKYAGLAMQPASGFGTQPRGATWQQLYGRIKSPMFMFSGTADILVSQSWVRRGFDALSNGVEAYHWSARGSTHIPTPNAETSEVAIPWFRWKLLGDNAACERFKSLEAGTRWSEVQVQNEASCAE